MPKSYKRHPARTNGWSTFYALYAHFHHIFYSMLFFNRIALSVFVCVCFISTWFTAYVAVAFVLCSLLMLDDLNFMHTKNPFGSSLVVGYLVGFHTNNFRRRTTTTITTIISSQRSKGIQIQTQNSQSCIQFETKFEMWFFCFLLQLCCDSNWKDFNS